MIKIFGKAVTGLILVFAIISGLNTQQVQAQPGVSVSVQTFYNELEPYGQWIEDPELGYVWSPDAGTDFKPYATNGHWVETQYGNTWVSDYEWGWAAFHYGRWRYANDYGWEWIPGTEWGPAWVNWRTGGDYYGWAPLGPGIDIDIAFGSGYYAPNNYWVFVPRQYVCSPNPYRYYVPASRNVTIIRNTTIINNTYNDRSRRYISGPRPDDLQRFTGNRINVYDINNSHRPGGTSIRNNTLNIYRPEIAANRNDNNQPAPSRVINRGNYDNRNGFNNNDGRSRDITNRNPAINNPRQPMNQGNNTVQGSYPANNDNNSFGRSRGNNNTSKGNQFPQGNGSNTNNNGRSSQGTVNGTVVNGNNPSNSNSRPSRDNLPTTNQAVPNTNGQQGTDWRQSRGFDRNRDRGSTDNRQIQQNQQQTDQNQQRQQQMQQRNQQQQADQNQRNQQQMQQRQQQQIQERPQQQRDQQQQRPARLDPPPRNNDRG